jgi:hypothetical protein
MYFLSRSALVEMNLPGNEKYDTTDVSNAAAISPSVFNLY